MLVQLIFLTLFSGLVAIPLALWTELTWWGVLLLSPPLAFAGIWVVSAVIDFIERPAVREWGRQQSRMEKDVEVAGTTPGSFFDLANIPSCPKCHAGQVAKIVYGQSPEPEALQAYIDAGRVVLGGCVVYDGAPRWQCRNCGHSFGSMWPENSGREEI